MTVIADDSGALSLGGVIGGESTGCTEATTDVFIEAALFDPVRTAATGRKLNLQSDARYRFERGARSRLRARRASRSATRLIARALRRRAERDRACGRGAGLAAAPALPPRARAQPRAGSTSAADEQRRILEGARLHRRPRATRLAVEPPSWRGDIEGEADLVEEVLRIHGYEHIPAVPLPRATARCPSRRSTPAQRRAGFVRRSLAARGLVEAVTFSFMPPEQAELFGGGARGAAPRQSDQRRSRRDAALDPAQSAGGGAAQRRPRLSRRRAVRGRRRNIATTRPKARISMAAGVRAGRTGAQALGRSRPAGRCASSPRPMRWRRSPPPASPADSAADRRRSARLVSPRPRRRAAPRRQACWR